MKLTIITITKNDLKGLEVTAESVFNQSFIDYEYILIDGDSNDGSKEFIQSIAIKLSFWLSEPDKGIYNAMNKGIQKANGTYLMFLNSGDRFCNNHVLEQFFLEDSNADVIHGNVIKMDAFNNLTIKKSDSSYNLTSAYFLYDTIYHQGSFIRKSVFDKFGLYDENYKIISDWIMFLKLAINKCYFEYKNIDIAYFDSGGISSLYPDLIVKEKTQELSKTEYGQLLNDFIEINRLKASLMTSKEFNIVKSNKILSLLNRAYLRYHYKKLRNKAKKG